MELVAPAGPCIFCQAPLDICQHRERPLQTLTGRYWVVSKDRRCRNHEACPGGSLLYRPGREGSLVLKGREYGLDIICYVGERYLRGSRSLPRLHKDLREAGVLISERHVSNLLRLFLALIKCRDGEDEGLRKKLREQGRLIISIDAVRFDDVSPKLYVVRDVLSGEILFCERIEVADAAALKALLSRVLAIEVPVAGVISDKEQAIALAVEAVFPGVPHQFCQVHYLRNLVRTMESDLAQLASGVKDVVKDIRDLEQKLSQQEQISDTEREVAKAVCFTVKTVGKSRSGDPLLEPPALRRFNRLTEATKATTRAVGNDPAKWPFLLRLLAALAALNPLAEMATRLQRQFVYVREIAHILHTQASGEEVRKILIGHIDKVEQASIGSCEAYRGFMGHVSDVTARFWKGLFGCYDHPDLPSNNNALEGLFGSVKQQQRRVHGRKSTAGGPLDGCAEVLLEVWSRLDDYPDLLAIVRDLPEEKVKQVREKIDELAGPSRIRRSIARDPDRYLSNALAMLAKK